MSGKRIRILVLWIAIAVFMSCLTSCGIFGRGNEGVVNTDAVKFYTRSFGEAETKPDNAKIRQLIAEKSGVNVEVIVIPSSTYTDKLNIMIATGEVFDTVNLQGYSAHWSELKAMNAIKPLNEALDMYGPNIKALMGDAFKATMDSNGTIWGIPRKEEFPTGFVPTIRKDWLEKFGMEPPETMEQFEAYMEAVLTKNPSGNGLNNEIPLLPGWKWGGLTNFHPYFVGVAGDRYLDEADGKIKPVIINPGYKDMLIKIREWYKKGYLYKEFFVIQDAQFAELILSDRVGTTAGWYSSGLGQTEEMRKVNPNVQFIPLPVLRDGKAQAFPSNAIYSPELVVSSTSTNTEDVIKYLDWLMSSMDNYILAKYGIEGEHWEWVDKAEKSLRILPGADKKYTGFYATVTFTDPSIWPTLVPDEDDVKNTEYRKMWATLRNDNYSFLENIDAYIPLNLKGTAAENVSADADTLIEENRIRFILGEIDEAQWDAVIEQYMDIAGNVIIEEWTKLYNLFLGI